MLPFRDESFSRALLFAFSPLRDSRRLAQQEPQKKSQVAVGRAEALIGAAYKNIAVHRFRDHLRRTHGLARPQIEIDLQSDRALLDRNRAGSQPGVRERGKPERS